MAKENVLKLVPVIIMMIISLVIMLTVKGGIKNKDNITLEVFGYTTKYINEPFLDEKDNIYMSLDDLKEEVSKDIIYDKNTNRVILTTDDNVVKIKLGETKITDNGDTKNIHGKAIDKGGVIYLPIKDLEYLFNIKVQYFSNSKTYVIDYENIQEGVIKSFNSNIMSALKSDSIMYKKMSKGDKVFVYQDALTHKRWYKARTEDGFVGYIPKGTIELGQAVTNKIEKSNNVENKIVMVWQHEGANFLNQLSAMPTDVLTHISPWAYVLDNGNGNFKEYINSEYINAAKGKGLKVWPLVTNISSKKNYAEITTELLSNEENREQAINNIIAGLEKYDLEGVNIDFEAMRVAEKDLYSQFLKEMKPLLKAKGIKLSVDIYFVGYMDRKAIGKTADYTVLMGYDQHWSTSSESGSVAELPWVEDNIKTLIETDNIPSTKIILGVPFLTRLWEEETNGTETKVVSSKALSIDAEEEYISKYNLKPTWDENAKQNYVERKAGDTTYKMWLEDSSSMKLRVSQVNDFNLSGISGWRKGLESNEIWETIRTNLTK